MLLDLRRREVTVERQTAAHLCREASRREAETEENLGVGTLTELHDETHLIFQKSTKISHEKKGASKCTQNAGEMSNKGC